MIHFSNKIFRIIPDERKIQLCNAAGSNQTMKFAEVQVGVPYPEKKFTLTEKAVKTYLAAVEDDTPLYTEERLVPPAYAAVYTRWEALTGEHLEDGTVHAKQGFSYLKPVHWGETLTLRGQVKEKMERRGLKFVVQMVEAFTEAGELAVECEITIIPPA